jgi:PAS domain S-box-containing protein
MGIQLHDDLEQRVLDRTAELSIRIAELTEENHGLRQTQALLEAMLENVPDRIYFKDAQSRFLKVSKALLKRINVDDVKKVIGKTDLDFMPPEKANEFFQDEQRIIKSGEPLINKIEKQVLPNGDPAWTSTTKVPLRDADGSVIGIVGINRDITALKLAEQKIDAIHKELLEVSRQTGMAEVATGVLHNVGNVLNSVNVAAAVTAEIVHKSKATGITRLANLFAEHANDLGQFLTTDERGQKIPDYLQQLSSQVEEERARMKKELTDLLRHIDHIKTIVSTQQNYARVGGMIETVILPEVIEDALRMQGCAYERHGIRLVRDFDPVPAITVDKHKVMQIVINLLSNAKYACDDGPGREKQVIVRLKFSGLDRVKIEVSDNGMGIKEENLLRVFSQGFTTRKMGHGFGLHSGALSAKEMGGSLTVHSDGAGKGATFTLDLPTVPPPRQKG